MGIVVSPPLRVLIWREGLEQWKSSIIGIPILYLISLYVIFLQPKNGGGCSTISNKLLRLFLIENGISYAEVYMVVHSYLWVQRISVPQLDLSVCDVGY